MRLTVSELESRYEKLTGVVRCQCEFATELVGGQPADEKAIRAFAQHHLKIADPAELESAVQRIMKEEVGERDTTPDGGELKESKVYGVNVIRRTEHGSYLGNWMVQANIKQSASRLGIFRQLIGTKGNFAEGGRATAIGASRIDADNPDKIYLISPEGGPAKTYYQEFSGRVNSPQGAKSIIHHSECVAPGTQFAFEFRFLPDKVSENDLADTLALAMIVGLGSAKALGRGKFRILECEIEIPKIEGRKPEKKKVEIPQEVTA